MDDDKLIPVLLWNLSKSIRIKVNEHRDKGALLRTQTLYIKTQVERFEYKEGGSSYQTKQANVEKDEWHWRDQLNFVENVIKQLPQYLDCVKEISNRYKLTEQESEYRLSRFVQAIAHESIEQPDDEFVIDKVTTFVSDLDEGPTDWKISVDLHGVWLKEEKYELADGILLRRPNPNDLEVERPFDSIAFHYSFTPFSIPSSILELTIRCKSPNEAQSEVEVILDVLRLFRLGSVDYYQYRISPKSILRFGGTFTRNSLTNGPYQYAFQLADIAPFNLFIGKIKPLLPRDPGFADPAAEIDPLIVSFQRYKEALLALVAIESRITSAITCLESLYLKAEERMELAHRLGQRVAALLRLVGFRPLEVYTCVNQAYDIRSTYIHGSRVDKERQQSAQKLCEKVMEYARQSLLIFLQLKKRVDKDDLISKLDHSLLDEKAFQKTKELISTDILIPN